MPITSYSTVAPLEHVWAFGWFINKLLSRPPSTLALAGCWLLAIPSLIGVMALLGWVVIRPLKTLLWTDFLFGVPGVLFAACYLLLAIRVTRAYITARSARAGAT